jgi:type II secretory pathway component PulM
VRNKVIIGILLLIAVFLVSFFPQFLKARRLETELREARQQYAVAQLRDVIGLAYLQASQKNYGLAARKPLRGSSAAPVNSQTRCRTRIAGRR